MHDGSHIQPGVVDAGPQSVEESNVFRVLVDEASQEKVLQNARKALGDAPQVREP